MTAMSDYLESALLNHVLRNVSYTPPTTLYLAFYTAAPTDSGGGTEVTGGSYARQAVTFAAPTGGAGTSVNSNTITFTSMPASTVVAIGILDAASNGNLLLRHTLPTPKTYGAGENVTIAPGDLVVTFD